jgi:uncharacterized phosphosugar-binding protein
MFVAQKFFFVRAARRSLRVARCASLGPGNLKFNHRAHFIFASHSGVGPVPVTEADVRRAKIFFRARCASLAARRSLRVARCASLGPGNLKFNHRAHFIFASHSGVGPVPVTEADVRRAKIFFRARCASLAARRTLRVARCASLGPGNLKFNHRAHFIFASHSGVGPVPVTEADVRRAKIFFRARCASLAARRTLRVARCASLGPGNLKFNHRAHFIFASHSGVGPVPVTEADVRRAKFFSCALRVARCALRVAHRSDPAT